MPILINSLILKFTLVLHRIFNCPFSNELMDDIILNFIVHTWQKNSLSHLVLIIQKIV